MDDKLIELKQGQEYYCWFTNSVLEFVGWKESGDRKVPLVRNNYKKGFNLGRQSRTWCHKYLRNLKENQLSDYKNSIHNTYNFKDFTLYLYKDEEPLILTNDESGSMSITLDEIDQMKKLIQRGYEEKY